jgi:hypothetical protein
LVVVVVVVEALVVGLLLLLELGLVTVGPEAGSDAPPVAELGRATAAAILICLHTNKPTKRFCFRCKDDWENGNGSREKKKQRWTDDDDDGSR